MLNRIAPQALDPDTYPLRTHLGCHNQEFGRVGRISVHENCLVQTHLMPEHNGRRILPGVQTRVTITDQLSVHVEMIQTNPDFVAPRAAQSAREWIHLMTQSFSTCGTRSSTSLCANDVLLRKDDLVVLTTSEAMVWSHDEFAHMLYVGLSVLHDIRDAFDRAPISLRGRITEFSLAVRAALLPDFLSLFDPENGKRHVSGPSQPRCTSFFVPVSR